MDEDFDLAGFDEAYDISDFGEDQAFSTSEMAGGSSDPQQGNFVDMGLGGDDDSLSSILNPALGSGNRTNITNVGGGSNLVYDPAFAAAIDIRRGIDPTLNLGGTGGVMVPASLRPQIPGQFMTTPLGEADMVRPMFNSQLERILQQTLPEIVRSGPVARIATGIGNFFGDLFSEGKEFAKDATGGIKLPSLQEIGQGFTNFMDRFRPQRTVTDTNAMNMPEAAIIREKYDYGDRPLSAVIGQNTFGSMPRNTGIASVRPQQMQDVDRNVADALQLIPSNLETNPIAPTAKVKTSLPPSDIFNLLPTERDREKRDFARDVFTAFPDERQKQFGRFNQDFINRTLNPTPFDDTGTFINLDNI